MQVNFSPDDLRPIVESVLSEVAGRFADDGRLAYTETEAATLIGVPRHVLRDERLRGRVEHGRCGKKVLYTRGQLLRFVEGKR